MECKDWKTIKKDSRPRTGSTLDCNFTLWLILGFNSIIFQENTYSLILMHQNFRLNKSRLHHFIILIEARFQLLFYEYPWNMAHNLDPSYHVPPYSDGHVELRRYPRTLSRIHMTIKVVCSNHFGSSH